MTNPTVAIGYCPGCGRDVPLRRVRPWPDMGFDIGNCRACDSTLRVHMEIPEFKSERPFTDYLQETLA